MAEEETNTPEVTEEQIKDLDPRFIKQLETAEKSIDKNPAYVIDICSTILMKHPSAVEVRKILRQAQFKHAGKYNAVKGAIASIQGAIFSMTAGSKLKKGEYLAVIDDAEKLLTSYPYNVPVLQTLAKAAEGAGYLGTAAAAYQAIAQFQPNNVKNMITLGRAYVKNKQADEAMQVADSILRKNPSNGDAQELARSASVIKTMNKGNWEDQDKDFKDKLKDSAEALEREKQTSSVSDEETLNRLVEKLKAQIETDPENINLYREIIGNLRTLQRYDDALEYTRKAREQPLGKGDTTFEKMENDFIIASMDQKISKLAKEVEANPGNKELAAELEKLKKDEHDMRLENARVMVERYPNDFNYRYIYGKLLFDDGRLDDAIMQFQISQRNPKVRIQSLLGHGRAFAMGKKYDLAVDQLETAKKESKLMNEAKKEIIYELASSYELMGKKDLAFNEYKEIYSSDISYRDVAKKINDYYESR